MTSVTSPLGITAHDAACGAPVSPARDSPAPDLVSLNPAPKKRRVTLLENIEFVSTLTAAQTAAIQTELVESRFEADAKFEHVHEKLFEAYQIACRLASRLENLVGNDDEERSEVSESVSRSRSRTG